jgi:uncharacterized linocin/CFP29 family protein
MTSNALLDALRDQFDPTIVPVLRANSIGRQLMPINTELSGKGLGVLTVETLQYVARSEATTNLDIQQDNYDTIDIKRFPTTVPVQQDDVIIKYRDWQAYQLKGIPIENDVSTDMTANIVREQDKLIIDGWKPDGTNYEIKGMYNVAGNSVSASDGGTYGNLKAAVISGISLLKEDGVYSNGYNLSLAPFNYAELMDSENSYGKEEYDAILRALNTNLSTPVGRIFEAPDLAAGTGMISPVATQENRRFFDLIETQPIMNNLWFADGNEKTGDIKMQQVGAIVPRFKHLDPSTMTDVCICKITGLGSS